MSQKWSVCRDAFSRCKKQQDAALAFVSKCKTSTTLVEEQYKQLIVVSNSIDRYHISLLHFSQSVES